MVNVGDFFKPGDRVPCSGLYLVHHNPLHAASHAVTCIFGENFPPCLGCKGAEFELLREATHVKRNKHFAESSHQELVS